MRAHVRPPGPSTSSAQGGRVERLALKPKNGVFWHLLASGFLRMRFGAVAERFEGLDQAGAPSP